MKITSESCPFSVHKIFSQGRSLSRSEALHRSTISDDDDNDILRLPRQSKVESYSTELLDADFRIGSTFRSTMVLHILDPSEHADVILSFDWMAKNKIHLDAENALYNDTIRWTCLHVCARNKMEE